jgi:lipid-A-disaccharide synthase
MVEPAQDPPATPGTALPPPEAGAVDLLVIVGEHSGDQHAARLLTEAFAEKPDLRVCALGGPRLAEAGAQLLYDLTDASVVGLVEVLRHYGFFKRLFNAALAWIAEHRPRAVCFVDYPGFNLRLARALYRSGQARRAGGPTRLLYYISPQIWAWKKHRRFGMAEVLDALAVIFPFEVDCYDDTELPVTFVGHPFVGEAFDNPVAYSESGDILLFPGSRPQPVARIFPPMLSAFATLRAGHPDERATVLYPGARIRAELERLLGRADQATREAVTLRPSTEVATGKAVLTSSGTISLCCALAGIPGAIVYRAHPLTYRFGRLVAQVQYLGIANLLLERPLYPEFIQREARPARLAGMLEQCLDEPGQRQRFSEGAASLRALLAGGETSAGQWLLEALES